MTTTEKTLVERLQEAIQKHVQEIVEEEVKRVQERVERRAKDSVGLIAARVCEHFSMQSFGERRIVITVDFNTHDS